MQDDTEAAERYRAPALDKGLDILELLAGTEEALSQAEIAKALDRTPNEIYRMIDRLVRRGYVSRSPSDRYEITLKLFALAHKRPQIRRLVSQAMPLMRQFSRTAEQACHLVVYDRGNLVVVAQVDPPGYWSVAIRVGSHVGLVNTGSGHVFLAYATPEERAFMHEEHAPMPDEAPPPDLEARLKMVRSQGFEMMDSQQIQGVMNLSVPVFGPHETVMASLTSPFIKRLDTRRAPDAMTVIHMLQETSRAISEPDSAS